jgi:hypothetical protein
MHDPDGMTPAQIDAIESHLAKVAPRCPMCGGAWPATWALHSKLVCLPQLDGAGRPVSARVPAALLKCKRCRFMTMFRVAGGDEPEDVSAQI